MDLRGMSARDRFPILLRERFFSKGIAGAYCVAFALVHILFFRNKFFDINRCKYYLFVISAYSAFALAALAAVCEAVGRRGLRPSPTGENRGWKRFLHPAVGIALMCLSAIVSTAFTDEPIASVTGQNGRYAGLLFIGATCILYSFALWMRLPLRRVLAALSVSLGLCSLLGVLNFLGWDPLHFYVPSLSQAYWGDFLSTIGNINFFSACVCLLTGLSAGLFLRSKGVRSAVWLGAYCASILGLLASRSDGALIALAGVFFAMLLFGLRGKGECSRAFVLFAATSASAFLMYWLCRARLDYYRSFKDSIAGVVIKEFETTGCATLAFLLIAVLLRLPKKEDRAAVALWRVQKVLGALALIAVAAVIGSIVYFTYVNTEYELTGFLSRLRFSDTWGTFRGFIWNRTWRMYLDLPLAQKFFGTGPETLMKHIVANYNTEMIELTGITFDNAHNEFLHYLFTIGALGLAGYLAAIIGCYRLLVRRARESAVLYAIYLAISGYLLQSVFNIAQPETTPVLILLLALGCRRDVPFAQYRLFGRPKPGTGERTVPEP